MAALVLEADESYTIARMDLSDDVRIKDDLRIDTLVKKMAEDQIFVFFMNILQHPEPRLVHSKMRNRRSTEICDCITRFEINQQKKSVFIKKSDDFSSA